MTCHSELVSESSIHGLFGYFIRWIPDQVRHDTL